jgi:hypothetical protein
MLIRISCLTSGLGLDLGGLVVKAALHALKDALGANLTQHT